MANILIVEDDANMRILMSARLKGRHNVLLAKDGAEALEVFERGGVVPLRYGGAFTRCRTPTLLR